jgi:hypothetical protein
MLVTWPGDLAGLCCPLAQLQADRPMNDQIKRNYHRWD